MNEKFFDLKKDKQDRMINAALKIFALNGYRHASTDDIVREASISKGLLFHYFGSKLGTYTFMYEYGVRYMTLELKTAVNEKETDPFEILKQVEQAKMQALKGYPYMQQFLTRSVSEDVKEALMAVEGLRKDFEETNAKIRARMDFSGLPAGVDGACLIKMIEYTGQGLMNKSFLTASFRPDLLFQEMVDCIDMLKTLTLAK